MPIKGLSEQRRLPRLGKIRLGVKKKNQKGIEYPASTDYFVCPPGSAGGLRRQTQTAGCDYTG